MITKYYKSKTALLVVDVTDKEEIHAGEAIFGGGVRPWLFFSRKELSKHLKKYKFRRVRIK